MLVDFNLFGGNMLAFASSNTVDLDLLQSKFVANKA